MRTLVLGGTGMLGRAVCREGRRRGHAVLALSRDQADLTDAARLRYWAEAFAPEVIVNCAAHTRVDDCEREREAAFAINGEGVAHAAAAAEAVGARLVHVSTDYVFAGDGTAPYPVEAPLGPVSVYGESKLEGERAALAYPRSAVVRTSWLFGPGGPNFVRTIAGRVLAGQGPLRVVEDQLGAPTYTRFLARGLLDLASRRAVGVFHYQNRAAVTWFGFAQAIAEALAPGFPVEPVTTAAFPRPARRPAYSVLDVSRFESTVGRSVEPWSWGLAEYLQELAAAQGVGGVG
jgi:dTDP-4-dehydrorhamnose reductase